MASAAELLHPALQHHIVNSLGWRDLRPLQEAAIPPLLAGEHILLLAPTSGGKTEAAFFPVLSRLLQEEWRGLSVLYLCPIKALLNNLHARLQLYCCWMGRRVELWHGDIGESARNAIRRDPPEVLLTTPESLEVLLTSVRSDRVRMFGGLRAVIVDELHAFAGDDRGWHLLSVLARIGKIAGHPVQRVGLSATIGNPEALLDWLAAHAGGARRVIAPPTDAAVVPDVRLDHVGTIENAALVISRLHRGEKRLVFVDSRARVEQLAALLRGHGVHTFVSHSSVSLDERRRAEEAFAQGSDCVIVATSTLELGIDVGDLDRVIQLDAPSIVASFLQRLGRTGRRPGTTRNCLFLTTSDDGFLRAAGLLDLWGRGYVEPIEPPPLPFHLLAQQLMALCLQTGGLGRHEWRDWIGAVPCFVAMGHAAEQVLEHMLAIGILHEDQGKLGLGPEGERLYGRRNFLELYSIFETPPLFTVLHGRNELGVVHESSFHAPGKGGGEAKDVVLLLGGRSWSVRSVDWFGRKAWVEPADAPGRSRWCGGSRAMSFEHARAIRCVLAGSDPPGTLSQRAKDELAKRRQEMAWVDDTSTAIVGLAGGQRMWWTFAGLRINVVLAQLLGDLVATPKVRDSLALPLRAGASAAQVRERLETRVSTTPSSEQPEDGADVKFGDALPDEVRRAMQTARRSEVVTARLLAEPVREVIEV